MTEGSCSWMNPAIVSLGMKSRSWSHDEPRPVEVVALRELAHLQPHVAQELLTLTAALVVGGRVEVAQVGGERELHVHVQHVAFREQEREVGDRPAALDRGLLLVVDVLDEAGEPQHVFGHALAPLAARLAAGERLAQAVGGVGERASGRSRGTRAARSTARATPRSTG